MVFSKFCVLSDTFAEIVFTILRFSLNILKYPEYKFLFSEKSDEKTDVAVGNKQPNTLDLSNIDLLGTQENAIKPLTSNKTIKQSAIQFNFGHTRVSL